MVITRYMSVKYIKDVYDQIMMISWKLLLFYQREKNDYTFYVWNFQKYGFGGEKYPENFHWLHWKIKKKGN